MELPEIIHLPATPNAPERLNCIVIEEEGIAEVNPLLSKYDKALELYSNAKLINCIELLQQIVEIDTKFKDVKQRLEYYLLELEGIKKNVEILTDEINSNPFNTEAHFDLAHTYYVLNELDKAKTIWAYLSSVDTYYGKKAKKMLEKYFNGNSI